ncbi:hypothetical protein AX761_21960 [Rhizobium sp. 58]|nr:hypothetical protein AX761_21960 [Rhizobium sp. 58]
MVAYSFKAFFVPQIESGYKLQTVRANRKRHARSGEPIQLYQAMRTKHCRKIIDDPTCTTVLPVVIETSSVIETVSAIFINDCPLKRDEIEEFARFDGFDPERLRDQKGITILGPSARSCMGLFWLLSHGPGRFEGVLIRWAVSP